MKRLCLLILPLILLAGCTGKPASAPEETAAAAQENIPAYTLAASPKNPQAKPFTKDDLAFSKRFYSVGGYAKAAPAECYRVDTRTEKGAILIEFFDSWPKDDSRPFLTLRSRDTVQGFTAEDKVRKLQELPKELLDAGRAELYSLDFGKANRAGKANRTNKSGKTNKAGETGEAPETFAPPRGVKIGDPAQALFDAYPDYRSQGGDVLYDITILYPGAKPAWGNTESEPPKGITDWERNPFEGFLGGRIWEVDGRKIVRLVYMEQPDQWEGRGADAPWTSDLRLHYWRLDYTIEEETVKGIEFALQYEQAEEIS